MAISKNDFLKAIGEDCKIRAVGDPGGKFCIALDRGHKSDIVGNDKMNGPRYFPGLNHVADWLQRVGVMTFTVDLKIWRKSDTGRSAGATRP